MFLLKFYNKHRKSIVIASTIISLIGLLLIGIILFRNNFLSSPQNIASWYDNQFEQRKSVEIAGSGSVLTNEDVLIELDTASLIASNKLQVDCDDLRFVDSDDSSLLNYWIEGGCNTTNTQIWVKIPSLPADGTTIYVYYGNESAANAEASWSGKFINFSSVSCPGTTTRISEFDDRFPLGSDTYGKTGGTDSHGHNTLSCTSSGPSLTIGTYTEDKTDKYYTTSSHTHTMSATVSSATVLPPYLNMYVCGGSRLDLSQDMVYIFDNSVSPGWTRESVFDNRFPRGNISSYGTISGSTTHNHAYTGDTTSTQNGSNYPSVGGTPRVGITGTHSHTVTNGTTGGASSLPPYRTVIFAYPNSATESRNGLLSMVSAIPPLGWTRYTTLDNQYVMGSGTAGTLGGNSSHTHSVTLVTSASGASGNFNETDTPISMYIARSGHTHSCTIGSNFAYNQPSYISTIFVQRKTSQATVLGIEERSVPTAPTMLTAQALTTTSIRWNFADNSVDELGFKIYDEMNTLKVTCIGENLTHCDEAGLLPNTQYSRKVVAYNASGESEFSELTNRYTLTSIPSVSYGGSKTSSSIDLLGSGQVNGSELYFDCVDENCDTGLNTWTLNTDVTATDLQYNMGCEFRIKSRNGDNVETEYSENILIYTLSQTPSISVGPLTSSSISLNANDVRNLSSGLSGVYFECLDEECNTGINEWITTTSDTVISLSPNTQYTFRVKTRNYDGTETLYSENIQAYTLSEVPTITGQALSDTEIQLDAGNVNNLGLGSSAIYFECTGENCNTGLQEWITTTTDTVTGLQPNTQYTFNVKARNADGQETVYSEPISIYTQSGIPTISANVLSDSSVELTASNIGTLGNGNTAIYFECVGDSCNTGINEWIVSDTDTVTGLQPNTQYGFKVKARNVEGSETVYSETIFVYTYANTPNLTGNSLSDSSISVVAGNISNLGEGNSAIYFECITEGCSEGINEWISVDNDSITSLQGNTMYSVRVKARNADGIETAFSNAVGTYTLASKPNLNASPASSSEILLTATNVKNINIGDSGLYFECLGEQCNDGLRNWISLDNDLATGLLSNTQYTFKVKARNYNGIETDYSSNVSTYTLASLPSELSLKSSTYNSLTLTFGQDVNPTSTEYLIYDSISSKYYNFATKTLVADPVWTNKSSLSGDLLIQELLPGNNYNFKVKARNANNIETEYTTGISVYTKLSTPIVTTSQTDSTSQITWNFTDSNNSGTGFKIYDLQGNLLVDCKQSNISSCQEKGLSPNITYQRKIKAYNGNTESDFSNITTGTTYSQPSSITGITAVDSDTVTIVVNAGSGDTLQIYESTTNQYYNSELQVLTSLERTFGYSQTVTINGLNPDTTYSFRIRSANSVGVYTQWSSYTSVLTHSQVPAILNLNKIDSQSVRVFLNSYNNPSTTQYLIQDVGSGLFLDYSTNTLVSSEIWGTYSQMGGLNGIMVNELQGDGQFGFRVMARNNANVRTSYSQAQYVGTKSIILNVPEGFKATLAQDENIDLTIRENAQLGEKDVLVRKDNYLVADIPLSFLKDRDWNDVVLEFAPQVHKTVIKLKDDHGISGDFTMYVSQGDTNSFRICPQATKLDQVEKECKDEVVFSGGFPQTLTVEGRKVSVSQVILDGVKYWVADGLRGTGGQGFVLEKNVINEDGDDKEGKPSINTIPNTVVEGVVKALDITPLSNLKEPELQVVVTSTTAVTVAIGATTGMGGISQFMYLTGQFFSGIFTALGLKRKKVKYGFVYDSYTKQPIPMAMIRIFNEEGDLVESSVTDGCGRFAGSLNKGKYSLTVNKIGYDFPTKYLKGFDDYPLPQIYKGGVFVVPENNELNLVIPVDSVSLSKREKTVAILKSSFSTLLTILTVILFVVGIGIAIYMYDMYPSRQNLFISLIYIPSFILLLRSFIKKGNSYGVVKDVSGKVVSGLEIGVKELEFNSLVQKRVTNEKGRYSFVLGKGRYRIELLSDGYELINIKGGEEFVVKKDDSVIAKNIKVK